jgi:dinuclear metal center YbgI/SA1388 family protein
MPTNIEITDFCNKHLALDQFPDYGPMGLQHSGDLQVKGVASAVSINLDVIERTKAAGANLLLVHHGLFWNNESRVHSPWLRRFEALEEAGITLLAYHLALDAHPKIGNNILLARNLGLGKLTPWEEIGWSGEYQTPMRWDIFMLKGMAKLETDGIPFFEVSQDHVRKVAVIAGGAAQYVIEAHRDGFDTFVTGEPSEPSYNLAQDLGMNFFAFGHDKTERAGVQKLGQQIAKRFRIKHTFLPSENRV